LSLAQKRIRALGLQNIQVMLADVQAVLNGTVAVTCSLGLALHACGALSDLVLDFCLARNAGYCLVPCCLGAISNWHGGANVHYPRSSLFGNECGITLEDYLLLAARADQTACEADSAAYWLGKHAMGYVVSLFYADSVLIIALVSLIMTAMCMRNSEGTKQYI
jgi:hypothetical protein